MVPCLPLPMLHPHPSCPAPPWCLATTPPFTTDAAAAPPHTTSPLLQAEKLDEMLQRKGQTIDKVGVRACARVHIWSAWSLGPGTGWWYQRTGLNPAQRVQPSCLHTIIAFYTVSAFNTSRLRLRALSTNTTSAPTLQCDA